MALGIITAICSALTLAVGIWRYVKRLRREERKIADEAKQKLDKAVDDGDTSDITISFSRMRQINR